MQTVQVVPASVAAILEQISDLVTLSFDELWKPLQWVARGFTTSWW